MTKYAILGGLIAGVILIGSGARVTVAQDASPPPDFSEAYLSDPLNLEIGKAIWVEQCALCHGARAYPGKAPRLKPKRYTADFVYRRVTKGFRAMPGWEHIYDLDERMAVAAYVMDKSFSP